MEKTRQLLLCECESSEHQMIIRYFNDDEYPEVYLDIHLAKKPFWHRIKYAFKYIFGYQCKYGAFDEFIFNEEHLQSLENVVAFLKRVDEKIKLKNV
jgi:hypothetical protein